MRFLNEDDRLPNPGRRMQTGLRSSPYRGFAVERVEHDAFDDRQGITIRDKDRLQLPDLTVEVLWGANPLGPSH